jgi:hypothetical protein
MIFCEGACRKRPEFWPSIWFCSIAAHQAPYLKQFMAKNMMTLGSLKLKCTCKGLRFQDTGNVMKCVTAVLKVTQLKFPPLVVPLLG